jgi:hypothetical protein
MTSTVWRAMAVQADLGLVETKAVLAKFEIFFYRPPEPPARTSRAMLARCPSGTKQ